MMDNRPIGVFDSGLGGLTVVKELMDIMPNESIVYFGDTARVPYGSKSKETVIKFSTQAVNFLRTQDVKAVVIACNTASAVSVETLREKFDIPVFEVIESGAKEAVNVTKNKKVGIIATEGTVLSGAYNKFINNIDSSIEIFSQACSLFVPIVEDGWQDTGIAYIVAEKYLENIKKQGVDTLIMGCTHYPHLKRVLKAIMGDGVEIVNPARRTALTVKEILENRGICAIENNNARYKYYSSDNVEKFKNLGTSFLNRDVTYAEKINIEEY